MCLLLCTDNLTVYLRSNSLVELAMCHSMRMETDLDTVVNKINKNCCAEIHN